MSFLNKLTSVFKPSNALCLLVGIILVIAALYIAQKAFGKNLTDFLPGFQNENFEDYEDQELENFNEYYADDKPEEEKKGGAARILDAIGVDIGQ